PQRAGIEAPMFEVYVRNDPVLRLPPPIDRGRPTWIDADRAPSAGPPSSPAPRREPDPVPPPEHPGQASGSVREALGLWLTVRPYTADLPAEQRQWLAARVGKLAGNPRIQQAARVNSEDDFGLVFTAALEDDLVEA